MLSLIYQTPQLLALAIFSLLCLFTAIVSYSFYRKYKHKYQTAQHTITTLKEQQLAQATHHQEKITVLEQQATLHYHNGQQLQQQNTSLTAKLAAQQATLVQKEQHFSEQLQLVMQSKEVLKQEFEQLAQRVFEDKSKQFSSLNQQSMEQVLKPVQGELKGFRDKMERIHSEELQQRAALKNELLNLQKLNHTMTEQADKLTNALQGQQKNQGNWGELILENVLDSAGLKQGQDYQREQSFDTENGKKRPDVVVYLPEERHLVIDAKTSLNAYTRYVNAQDKEERETYLKQHTAAVSARITELAEKQYHRLSQLNSPEVVILFMPIESAYVEALKYKPEIYQQAINKNILVATPTTLLSSLNIVKQLWRFEDQAKHSAELAKRAERFYTKLNGFLTSLEGVGKQLDKAKESYEKAFSQLYSGKGNLIKQANEFKELGVAVQKELPTELVEKAALELNK